MFRKRSVDDIFKLRIIMYFTLPVILLAVVIAVVYKMHERQYYNLYSEFNESYADEVFANIDNEINAISRMDYWLKNDDVRLVFESDTDISDEVYGDAIKHMNRMKSDFSSIDSIMIVNRKSETVIATNGKTTIDKYFSDVSVYKDYSSDFFKTMIYPSEAMIKLPPTQIEGSNGSVRYVLPVIRMASPGENPNSFFVFNISIENLIKKYAAAEYTDNSLVCFVNKKNKQIYFLDYNANINPDERIMASIISGNQPSMYKDDKGNRYNIIVRTMTPNLMDYAYVVFIPVNDIDRIVSAATVKILVVSIVIYIMIAILVLLLASKVGNYFAGLISRLNFREKVGIRDVFTITEKISAEFQSLLDDNNSMKVEMKSMAEDVKEKMITDVINNKERKVQMTLYKYKCFLPAIFRIVSTTDIPDTELHIIEDNLYKALLDYFNGKYELYDITSSKKGVHLVFNIPETLQKNELKKEIEKLADIILKNEIDVTLEYYIADKCDSFEKLRDEYSALINDMESRTGKSVEAAGFDNGYSYRVSDSNAIINDILAGDRDKTIDDIEQIIITNMVNNVSKEDMKLLYKHLLNTLVTALKMKKMDVDKVIKDIGEDVYFDFDEKSNTEKARYILDIVDAASSSNNSDDVFMAEVMEYINKNYTDYGMTLESIAGHFDIDEKKLSKAIKKYNNVTFHKYITDLRIEDAKRLLITTDMSIEQIYNSVGYVSRTTFIRAFSSVEGVTPSEYRKRIKDKDRS